jgi:hypothetical protein
LLAFSRVAPYALEEIPADLSQYLSQEGMHSFRSAWGKWLTDADRRYDLQDPIWHEHDMATTWVAQRVLDCDNLPGRPLIWLWRQNDRVHWCWDFRAATLEGRPIYAATAGTFSQPVEQFRATVKSFAHSLLGEVERRTKGAVGHALASVRTSIAKSLATVQLTDWASVRVGLHGTNLEQPTR